MLIIKVFPFKYEKNTAFLRSMFILFLFDLIIISKCLLINIKTIEKAKDSV